MLDERFDGGILLPAESKGDRKPQVGSSHHFTSTMVLGDGPGVRTDFESHTERKAAMVLAYRRNTRSLKTQVLFEWSSEQNQKRRHFIDLVVERTDDRVVGYAVRPDKRVSQKYLADLARIKEQAVAKGFLNNLLLISAEDLCPVEVHNAKLFHSVMRADPFGDTVAKDVVRGMSGLRSISDLVAKTKLEGMGFRALVRLICSGHLEMLRHEKIGYNSMVFKKLTP
ncbi:hypothetical protein [Donghicola eburneus]|uniref:hypothetical protein n=1 Tax=Donghicola eburneus TaxID=393278 RepID=UPI0008E106CF|nr:hypothetical protein [Donghicola eburneus]SFQ79001.1 hypothetical protein SAMN05421764_1261 [Donghicola eburneus]